MLDLELEAVSSLTNLKKLRVLYDLGVRPEHFKEPVFASAVEWAFEYVKADGWQTPPTPDSLVKMFPSIVLNEPKESVTWLAEELKKDYMKRNLQRAMLDLAGDLKSDPINAAKAVYNTAWRLSTNVQDRTHDSKFSETSGDRVNRYKQRELAAKEGAILGTPIGFEEIDRFTNGITDGELAVVAGYAKAGKTWVGLNAAARNAQAGKSVLFVTLELSIQDIEDRIDAILSEASYSALMAGTLSQEDKGKISDLYTKVSDLGEIYIEKLGTGDRTVSYICRRARDLDVDLVVIDQLSFMEDSDGNPVDGDWRLMNDVVSSLKVEISRPDARNLPCILMAQMNRGSIATRHGRGDMSTLAGTSGLERASDIVYGISQSRQEKLNSSATLEILGSRRTGIKGWVIRRQLETHTEMKVLREREEDADE